MTDKVRNRYEWLYKALVITLLSSTLISLISFAPKAIDAINNRTFDSEAQKAKVLESAERKDVVSEVEKDRILQHTMDQNIHMSPVEKEQLIIIRENQKRIGSDLQEIKNILKRNN
tara:strand:+ start:829 stop:1176 length:348 start_codon:yes stop_codon:yes gene_type:complete